MIYLNSYYYYYYYLLVSLFISIKLIHIISVNTYTQVTIFNTLSYQFIMLKSKLIIINLLISNIFYV